MVIHDLKSEQIYWAIYNQEQQQICRYLAPTCAGKLEIDMPRFYAKQIEIQIWKVDVHPVENID